MQGQLEEFLTLYKNFESQDHLRSKSIKFSLIQKVKKSYPPKKCDKSHIFILEINKIVILLPTNNRFQVSFHMDDLQIPYRHLDPKIVKKKLEEGTKIVENFDQKNSFKFSTNKAHMIQFTESTYPPPLKLQLGNRRLQHYNTERYEAHVQNVKSKSYMALNLIRSVSSPGWEQTKKLS